MQQLPERPQMEETMVDNKEPFEADVEQTLHNFDLDAFNMNEETVMEKFSMDPVNITQKYEILNQINQSIERKPKLDPIAENESEQSMIGFNLTPKVEDTAVNEISLTYSMNQN